MIAIIDYGMGNLRSVQKALESLSQEAVITDDPAVLERATHVILPGVGAFGDAMARLEETGLDKVVKQLAANGKPLLGICLGMQLLFEKSFEYGEHEGLGLLKGSVVPMEGKLPPQLKIPHMGWNALTVHRGRLLAQMDGQYVYFVHSFFADGCEDSLSAVTE